MTAFVFELINGVKIGIEHVTGDEEDDFHFGIVLDFLILRLVILSMKPE